MGLRKCPITILPTKKHYSALIDFMKEYCDECSAYNMITPTIFSKKVLEEELEIGFAFRVINPETPLSPKGMGIITDSALRGAKYKILISDGPGYFSLTDDLIITGLSDFELVINDKSQEVLFEHRQKQPPIQVHVGMGLSGKDDSISEILLGFFEEDKIVIPEGDYGIGYGIVYDEVAGRRVTYNLHLKAPGVPEEAFDNMTFLDEIVSRDDLKAKLRAEAVKRINLLR